MSGQRLNAARASLPAGHRDVHRHNLSLVLEAVKDSGEVSRAHLADATGLTKATISSLVDRLIEFGLLVEGGIDDSGRVGRPGRLLMINSESVAGIGLEVNVDYVAVCVLDLLGVARHRRVVQVDNRETAPEVALETLALLGGQAVDWVMDRGMTPGGVTVAVPGLVEVESGTLVHAPNLGWKDLPFLELLKSSLGRPELSIHVENEANLGALGELWEGSGREWGDFVHVSGEVGVGAGLVFGGDLWRGFGGFAGELGHMQIDRSGPDCPCGSRGCLERFVGQEALLAAAGLHPALGTTMGTTTGGSVGTLVSSARAGAPRTLNALKEAGQILGGACASVANLLNPTTIVLGGIYGPLAPWILSPIEAELDRNTYRPRTRVVASELGMDAAVRGAASWALHRIMADPLRVFNTESSFSSNHARRTRQAR